MSNPADDPDSPTDEDESVDDSTGEDEPTDESPDEQSAESAESTEPTESAEPTGGESSEDGEPGAGEVYCRDCGAVISENAEICPACGVRQRSPPSSSVDTLLDELLGGGNPFVAALYSAIFPGLGQFYNREPGRGVAFVVASFLALLSMVVVVGFVLYPAVWLYAIYDAYTRADVTDGGSDEESP